MVGDAEERIARLKQRMVSQVLEIGIIFHSVIIGVTMGMSQNQCMIRPLVAALAFHQTLEGMGCIAQLPSPRLSTSALSLSAHLQRVAATFVYLGTLSRSLFLRISKGAAARAISVEMGATDAEEKKRKSGNLLVNIRCRRDLASSCPPLPPRTPWLVFSCLERHGDRQIFMSVAEGRICHRKIPELRGFFCFGSYPGWLFMMDRSFSKCFLLDLKEMQKIQVRPPPKSCDKMGGAIITSHPSRPNCKIVCYRMDKCSLAVCDLNQDNWIEIKLKISIDQRIVDMASCGGKLYALTLQGRLAIVDYDQHPVVKLLEVRAVHVAGNVCFYKYLIESHGELFLAHLVFFHGTQRVYTCEVYKMDFSKMDWEIVGSLDDCAFFLSSLPSAMSCSASGAGIRGNSVYFVVEDDAKIYRFDMADKSVSVELPYPEIKRPRELGAWVEALV